jgi:nifR3 family TIM-barrel protein
MVYTEFVAAEALVRNVKDTVRKLTVSDDERPVGIQIYGRTVEAVVEAARIVESEAHPDVIDLNFGCPVKKVAGKGAGAGMLRQIPLMLQMTEAVANAVSTPVTVKTRLGWDASNYVFGSTLSEEYTPVGGWQGRDLAEWLQDCGAKALTIHGRTRAQMYTGEADWRLIGEVKRNPRVHIPIIGNGDITSLDEACDAAARYGVDAVMIGRATFGQPWLFSRKQLSLDEKIDVLKEQLTININRINDMKGNKEDGLRKHSAEYRGILHTRRHLAASPVFKGIPDFRQTRIAMLRAETAEELIEILEQCRQRLKYE